MQKTVLVLMSIVSLMIIIISLNNEYIYYEKLHQDIAKDS